MTGFGFKDRRVAIALKKSIQPGQATVADGLHRATEGYVLKTPVGGIPAQAAGVAGKATCTLYYINEADTLTTFKDTSDTPITVTVWNIATEPIAGDTYIQAKTVFGKLVADWEEC